MPQEPQKRVTFFTWIIIFVIFVPCDLAKLPLLVADFIPILGTALGSIAAFIISLIETFLGYPALWLAGMYRKSSATSVMLSLSTVLLDFVPGIDDIPFTTPSVLITVQQARLRDKKERADYEKAIAHFQREQAEQEAAAYAMMIQAANDEETYARAA